MKANPFISAIRFNKFFWIIFSLIIISNLLFYFTIGRSQRNKIEELQNQYRTKRTIKVAQKDDDLSKLLQARQDVQYFIDQLGIRSEFPTVINELFQILHQNGLSVNKMTYNPELIEFRNLLKFTTHFTVNGRYGPIKAFLADLQESKALFCIDNLSIQNRSTQEEENIEITLQVSTFFQ